MYIDTHGHGCMGQSSDGTIKEHIAGCRLRGIDRIILIGKPGHCFELMAKFPDFIIPVIFVDIDTVTPEKISNLFARGAKGIKFIAPEKSYGHESYFPLYECVRNHGGVAVFHTGYMGLGYFEKGCAWEKPSPLDITNMRPAAIDRIVRVFPDLKILMAHFGNPWWEEAWKIISSHKNVYADLSGGTAFRRSLLMWSEIFAPNGIPDTKALARLCFGSDVHYFHKDNFDFEPYQEFYERLLDRIKVPQALRNDIYSGNILSLLK